MTPHTAPKLGLSAFNCPHCGAFAKQKWRGAQTENYAPNIPNLLVVLCDHCHKYSLWVEQRMVFPSTGNTPLPNFDLPQDIQDDYEEARSIVSRSPRGAAALLRLAIQKLCVHLGEKGKNLNTDIARLVKKGLPEKMRKGLDAVRVIGNNAAHPGQIDLKDDPETAEKLFEVVNVIAEAMISQPQKIDGLYSKIPPEQQNAISKRDGKTIVQAT